MREGQASRTAGHNALFRALESSMPPGRRVFDDPLARSFLSWPHSWVAALGAAPGGRALVRKIIDARWPGVRPSVVARTALIDEEVTAHAEQGLAQLVILGAGYDSRPYRLPALRHASVFEVDHPATQAAKKRALTRILGELPGNVRFIASDFNHDQLGPAMAAAGYRSAEPAIFLCEGVTNYLTEAAVDATLRWCSLAAPGSVLIFTYVNADVLTDPGQYAGAGRLMATLSRAGERLSWGADPAELPGFLAARGLLLERDTGAADYRRSYLGPAAARICGHEFYRVAQATVGERQPAPRAGCAAA